RAGSKTPDLLQKHPPHDELSGSFEGQFTHRLRRDGGCLQGTGQATSWWRGHALDISRRSRRSSTQGCRPNQQPMERILAQNLPVRRGDRSRLYRLIILYIIWESHPWIGQSHVTAITINRLTQRQVGAMIDGVVGNKLVPASIRQDIIERTDGIPLFVEEMTKAVLEAES